MRKAIMKRSFLEKVYFRKKTDYSLRAYKKQKNYCSRLYKKERKQFFNDLNPSFVSKTRLFWKTVKPFFSNKDCFRKTIKLVEDNEVIQTDKDVAETLNCFFQNAVSNLEITENSLILNKNYIGILDPIEKAVVKYGKHPSILTIKNRILNNETFSFVPIVLSDVENEIKRIDPKKATTDRNIPPKILKASFSISSPILHKLFNDSIETSIFPDSLKLADVTPVLKKKDPSEKSNYRPVSVLPIISKVFEKLILKQINAYIQPFLSSYICGFRKGFNTQHALISLIEKWKKSLDSKGFCGAVLMDLSKAFDTLNHELLIAKLHAYGFQKDSLSFLHSYLTNRWQRTKVNSTFSSWSELIQGVPQGSVLGPVLFNIYLNDMFFLNEWTEICNFADDTTIYACDTDLSNLCNRIEHDSTLTIEWFENNYMKLNKDKCHLIVAGHKHETVFVQLGQNKIWESPTQKLLGIEIDNSLKFDEHVLSLCKKAGQKLSVLARVSSFMSVNQRRILMKTFIEAQFNYCTLVWMFCGRKANSKINNIHERSLRIVYSDYHSSFEELLEKDNSFKVHYKNIQSFAIELFKVKLNVSNRIMYDILETRYSNYNLRSQPIFNEGNVNTCNYSLNSLRYFASKVWSIIPMSLKNIDNVEKFKSEIKKWKPKECSCKLCRSFIQNLGYI